jgi:glycogen synthase
MRYVTNVSCSRYVASQFKARSTVIPNAFDFDLFRPDVAVPKARDFVFCGRLVSDKGADICLRAFYQVLRQFPDSSLTIIGDGPENMALRREASILGLRKSVHFAGPLRGKSLVSALQQHVCMVVPSLWEEPFGIVALEGVACCDTVILARRGGLPEAGGPCGLIVEPTVEDLSQAMLKIAAAWRAGGNIPGHVSVESREEHLQRHAPEAISERYVDVLRQACGVKGV